MHYPPNGPVLELNQGAMVPREYALLRGRAWQEEWVIGGDALGRDLVSCSGKSELL